MKYFCPKIHGYLYSVNLSGILFEDAEICLFPLAVASSVQTLLTEEWKSGGRERLTVLEGWSKENKVEMWFKSREGEII